MGIKGEETRKSILQAAAFLFWEHSYNLVKVDQIVEKAKVNKATFYRYFKSKEEVSLEAIDFMYEMTLNLICSEDVNSVEDPIKRLEMLINVLYKSQVSIFEKEEKLFGCPFVNMSTEMANESEAMRQKVLDISLVFEKYYQGIYEEAREKGLATTELDPVLMGRQLFGIINSSAISSVLKKRPEEYLDALVIMKILIGAK